MKTHRNAAGPSPIKRNPTCDQFGHRPVYLRKRRRNSKLTKNGRNRDESYEMNLNEVFIQ